MDIQISSNFERYLYYLSGKSSEQLVEWMDTFKNTGKLTIEGDLLAKAQTEMGSARVSQDETLEAIKRIYKEERYILDPHTAVGVCAASKCELTSPVVCLGTAHPAKFGEAVQKAIDEYPNLPETLASLESQETRLDILPATPEAVKQKMTQILESQD